MKTTHRYKTERNNSLGLYYGSGRSMRECSKKFGVCLERVRQILERYFPELIRARGDTSNHSTGLTSGQRVARRGR